MRQSYMIYILTPKYMIQKQKIQIEMNYEYLQYWAEAMENIELVEQLMENNLYMYLRTEDMLYLEYIINNIKDI